MEKHPVVGGLLCVSFGGAAGLGLLLWQQNRRVQTEEFVHYVPGLPKGLEGYRIVHLSDLHNRRFGKRQKVLAQALRQAGPDVVVVTGDFLNRKTAKKKGAAPALEALRRAAECAPVYFVGGNNEWESGIYQNILPKLKDIGVQVLENKTALLLHQEERIFLMGLSDISALPKDRQPTDYKQSYFYRPSRELPESLQNSLDKMCELDECQKRHFRILLTHRPTWAESYSRKDIDLMLCGHAHGGQVRLPVLGGLFAPQQGLFPQYTAGGHRFGKMTMYISRGLGNNGIPCRLFNDPQVQVIVLRKYRRVIYGERKGR